MNSTTTHTPAACDFTKALKRYGRGSRSRPVRIVTCGAKAVSGTRCAFHADK